MRSATEIAMEVVENQMWLDATYGEAQVQIQLEMDWAEQALHFHHCTECGPNHMIQLPDGSWQCGQCD